jgi:hypothetical protein
MNDKGMSVEFETDERSLEHLAIFRALASGVALRFLPQSKTSRVRGWLA